jgi:hypothetical protein
MTNAQNIGNADDVLTALQAQGLEVLKGKGGFWIRGEGHITLAQARKRTGTAAPKRERRATQPAWGDFASIAALNQITR